MRVVVVVVVVEVEGHLLRRMIRAILRHKMIN